MGWQSLLLLQLCREREREHFSIPPCSEHRPPPWSRGQENLLWTRCLLLGIEAICISTKPSLISSTGDNSFFRHHTTLFGLLALSNSVDVCRAVPYHMLTYKLLQDISPSCTSFIKVTFIYWICPPHFFPIGHPVANNQWIIKVQIFRLDCVPPKTTVVVLEVEEEWST